MPAGNQPPNPAGNAQATEQARARQVEQILEQLETLPTLSPIATRLLNIGSNDRADLKEIIRLIESDPALSVRILGLCKRADKGLGDRIKTVQHAVVMLGLETVRSAVLTVSVYEVMNTRASEMDKTVAGSVAAGLGVFDRTGFWKHALGVACASELIARAHPKYGCRADEVFSAGLLHDLGKLTMELVLPQSFARVLSLAERKRVDSATVERAVLGLDHHTAGKRVAEHWGLPEHLQDVIWLHGQPFRSLPNIPHKAMIGVVTVAKALCRQLYIGWTGDFGPVADVAKLCAETGLDKDKVAGIVGQLHSELSDRCRAIGLDDRTDHQLLLESIWTANRELNKMNEALSERSAIGERASKVLGAIAQLHLVGGAASTLAEAAGAVISSVRALCGDGRFVLVVQSDIDEPWQAFGFSRTGELKVSRAGDGPVEADGRPDALASWIERPPMRLSTLAQLMWMSGVSTVVGAVETLRPLPLISGSAGEGMGAILLHDREFERSVGTPAQRESLVGAWAAAICAAGRQESAHRLTERLAESSRAVLEMQARMSESESMARLGEVTAGAAHEMNNPLTIISGRAQLLARRLTDERDKAAAESIVEAGADLTDLITSLHLLSQPPEVKPADVPMMVVLEHSVETALTRRPDAAAPLMTVAPEAATAHVDAGLLARALAELILNAIECRAAASVRLNVVVDPSGALEISVRDDGPGLTPKAVRHAFDPFFSEKPAGRQRGLGLARARRLVEAIGGQITLENAPGGGACATIILTGWAPAASANHHAGRAAA